ncbi:MAG: flippase-like domain-containing protein [Deltaproteobacteria bacterium]|nr:flippase-like domain-containing protein [Deltaproteobacteria bacterium]
MTTRTSSIRSTLLKTIPWIITCVALYLAFRGVDWPVLYSHLGNVEVSWLILAIFLTSISYLMRARRWQFLFPKPTLDFFDSAKVLILGFFMNNILPARAGEFVRAHMGAKVSNESRTLVLATVASERLADGLTLSLFFVIFAFHRGDQHLSTNLTYVALLFLAVLVGVLVTLLFRHRLFRTLDALSARFNHKASHYTLKRIQIFIEGLTPLCTPKNLPHIVPWSLIIWATELSVYVCITHAFHSPLPLALCVLFMVTVNFSSLIPAAPGGIGVIEAIASAVLVSVGVPKELALTMVLTQHVFQYAVVAIPGAMVMLTWKSSLQHLKDDEAEPIAS